MFNYNNILNFSDFFEKYDQHNYENLDYEKIINNFLENINNKNYINETNIKYIDYLLDYILLKKNKLLNNYLDFSQTKKNKYINNVKKICYYLLENNIDNISLNSLSLILHTMFCNNIIKYVCKNCILTNKILISMFNNEYEINLKFFNSNNNSLNEIFNNFSIKDLKLKLDKCDKLEKCLIRMFSKWYFSNDINYKKKKQELLLNYYKITNSIPNEENISILLKYNYDTYLFNELLKLGVEFTSNNLIETINSLCNYNENMIHNNIKYLLDNNIECNNDHLKKYILNIHDYTFQEDIFEKFILCGSTFKKEFLFMLSKKNIILKNIKKYNFELEDSDKEELAIIFTERDKFFPYPYSNVNFIKPNVKCLEYLSLKRNKYDINIIKKYIKTYDITPNIICLENACLTKQNVSIINLFIKKYHFKPNEKCLKNIAYTINNKSLITIIDLYFKNIENNILKNNLNN